jgi:DNA-binding MarR family transcriptional regulator
MPPNRTARRNDFAPADSVSQLLRHTHRAFMRMMEQRLARHGIIISAWFVLRVLWERDGLSQAELAERVGIVGPTMVTAIRRLVQDGLATRLPDPDDKRKVKIYLTPKAQQLRSKLLAEAAEVVDLATAGLSSTEIRHLNASLRRIAVNLGRFLPTPFLAEVEARIGQKNGRARKAGGKPPPKRVRSSLSRPRAGASAP